MKRKPAIAYGRFILACWTANAKAAMEYRVDFFVQVLGMILNNAAFALFWDILIKKAGSVGGYGFRDIMMVWALVSTSFGLAHALAGNIRSIGRLIMEGGLDVYLLQPKSVYLNVVISRTVVSAWGDFAYGWIVMAVLHATAMELGLFALATLFSALIFVAAFTITESLSFFMGNSSAVTSALLEFLLSFSLYPDSVFPKELRWAFYTVLPSAFIAFVPLHALRALDLRFLALVCGAAVVYLVLSVAFFRYGLKRYESGNRAETRI